MHRCDLSSYDGTRLRVYEGGNPRGSPVVLVNGLGGNVITWRPLVRALEPHHHVVCFDYRGLFGSDPAMDGDYSIPAHARDLAAVLDAYGMARPTLIGWSMGVQVILEHLREQPHRASAFVAINGTPGAPFRTVFDQNLHAEMHAIFRVIKAHWRKVRFVRPFVRDRRVVSLFLEVLKGVGLTSSAVDRELFYELGMEWIELDLGIYSRIFHALADHDATDVLRRVRVPSLLVGGDKDLMTPLHRTALMASEIPRGEMLVVPGGTHFSLVEYPERIVPRVVDFVGRAPDSMRLAA